MLLGDIAFGAGSDFSWQAVATYGFDVIASEHLCTLWSATAHLQSISARTDGSARRLASWDRARPLSVAFLPLSASNFRAYGVPTVGQSDAKPWQSGF
jgi:hypothetical protein